jgi:hypothetical protein
MKSFRILGAVALAAIISTSFSSAPARASVYSWTLSGVSFNGSGTITLGTEETTNNGGGYLATGMTGEINTVGVTSPTNYYGSDNTVYPFATTVVDGFGLGVLLANSDMVAIDPGSPYNIQYSVNNTTYNDESFDLTLLTATPLPPTWTMLIAGFVGLGFFAYRGSKKSSNSLAAV